MSKRNYKQNCYLALTSEVLGERWTMLILRELFIQPCRFKQLNDWLPGMGTNLLTKRLKELETAGFVAKQDITEKRSPYLLTDYGRSLEPIVLAFIRWGAHHLNSNGAYQHQNHWDLLAMKALFDPRKCTRPLTVQFHSDELTAWVAISPESLVFSLGESASPDVIIPQTIAQFQEELNDGHTIADTVLLEFAACFDVI